MKLKFELGDRVLYAGQNLPQGEHVGTITEITLGLVTRGTSQIKVRYLIDEKTPIEDSDILGRIKIVRNVSSTTSTKKRGRPQKSNDSTEHNPTQANGNGGAVDLKDFGASQHQTPPVSLL